MLTDGRWTCAAEVQTGPLSFLHVHTAAVAAARLRTTKSRMRVMGSGKGRSRTAGQATLAPDELLSNTKAEVKSTNTTPASSLVFT